MPLAFAVPAGLSANDVAFSHPQRPEGGEHQRLQVHLRTHHRTGNGSARSGGGGGGCGGGLWAGPKGPRTRSSESLMRSHVAQHLQHAARDQWLPGRPLLSDTGGGGGSNWPPGILADPPTHPHQKIFPLEKNEIYQRGPNLEVDFRYTHFR